MQTLKRQKEDLGPSHLPKMSNARLRKLQSGVEKRKQAETIWNLCSATAKEIMIPRFLPHDPLMVKLNTAIKFLERQESGRGACLIIIKHLKTIG